jgi:acetate CoA/acetoacetate CoA-transferase alpha subunit
LIYVNEIYAVSHDKPLVGKDFPRGLFHMKPVSVEDAVKIIPDGATLMVGGFMGVGTPERLVDEIVRQGKRNLTVIANDTAIPGQGIGKLVDAGLVARTIASHIGLNPETQRQMIAGKMVVDLVPQGTLIERIRAGGFGLGGVLTPTGVGTIVEEDKQKIDVRGKTYLLETALRAEFALIGAFLADYMGNLSYALTARNFNPVIAMAADTTIVTAEHIVPVGLIAPDHVVTPAPLVHYLVMNEGEGHGRSNDHCQTYCARVAIWNAGKSWHRHPNHGCELRPKRH